MFRAFHNYADFSGRASRSEYWLFTLLNFLVYGLAFMLLIGGFASIADTDDLRSRFDLDNTPFAIGLFVIVVWTVFVIVPSIAVTVRRLHDRDMSGWWYLGFIALGLLPFVGWIANIAFLVVMCLRGTEGDNRFGSDPLGDGWSSEVFA